MKEIYEAPELNLISYVPAENLASEVSFEDLRVGGGGVAQTPISGGDIGIDF